MFDHTRLRPYLQLAGHLVLTFMAINTILTGITVLAPGWVPKKFFGVDFVEDNRLRAAGAWNEYRQGILDQDKRLVVILGLSSASEGITLGDLSRILGERHRFLGLCGAGRNMEEVKRYAQPLLQTDLKPDLVVFAIGPFHLIDGYVPDNWTRLEILGLWLTLHRRDIRHAVDLTLSDARSELFRYFEVQVSKEIPDPWRELIRIGLPESVSGKSLGVKIRQYGERGYYDAQTYQRSGRQAEILVDLISRFRQRQSKILIVLMPEHSELRRRIPPEGLALLHDALEKAFGEEAPTLVDLRDALDDSEFTDISHVNNKGRPQLNRLLAEAIRESISEKAQ